MYSTYGATDKWETSLEHVRRHSPQERRLTAALVVVCLGVALLLIAALPPVADADPDSVSTCLDPCHVSPGYIGPDVSTDYLGSADAAGHKMSWSARVVSDSSGATYPQNSRMPCEACHVTHGATTDSIYLFSTEHTGGTTITTVRQLCEGCHVPYDATADPVVVTGLVLRKLPYGVAAHKDSSTQDCLDCHGSNGRLDWKTLGYDGDPMLALLHKSH